jgi:flagellar biosynthesis protein
MIGHESLRIRESILNGRTALIINTFSHVRLYGFLKVAGGKSGPTSPPADRAAREISMTEKDRLRGTAPADEDYGATTPNLRPIRSPEAVAVALKYEADSADAPVVVAGGRGAVAEQLLEIAFRNGIKVREDADLAQLLSTIDIDSEIPPEAFAAVAEILIYIYRANGDMPDFLTDPAALDADPTQGETP